MERLLQARHVADRLGLPVNKLYKLLSKKKIPLSFVRLHGRMIAFRPSDVAAYLATHEVVRHGTGPVKEERMDAQNPAGKEPRRVIAGFLSDEEAQAFFDKLGFS